MVLSAVQKFNRSPHLRADIKRFAKSDERDAVAYLEHIQQAIEAYAPRTAADIAQLLAEPGQLLTRIDAHGKDLRALFPASAADALEMASAQTARSASVGIEEIPPQTTVRSIKGTVSKNSKGEYVVKTESGRLFHLATGRSFEVNPYLGTAWFDGMMSDGPIQLQGTFAADGTTFIVEGFALNTDGRYDQFLSGRVVIDEGTARLSAGHRAVTISAPQWVSALRKTPPPPIYLGAVAGVGTVAVNESGMPLPGQKLPADISLPLFEPGNRPASWVQATAKLSERAILVQSRRGPVRITHSELANELDAMPRLGIILPGATTVQPDGSVTYDLNPDKYYALGRFTGTGGIRPADELVDAPYARGDFAYSAVSNIPITLPPDINPRRTRHNQRIWLEGRLRFDANNKPERFTAAYVSKMLDLALDEEERLANQARADALQIDATEVSQT